MPRQLTIAIIGPGRLGTTLALALKQAGYRIAEIVSSERAASKRRARRLAAQVKAKVSTASNAALDADLIWFCVADRDIARVAGELGPRIKNKIAFHSSGALPGDELSVLRRHRSAVASVHPLMSFVRGSSPSLKDVSFAIEGDLHATRVARRIVRKLSGETYSIRREDKALYHAWGAFTSPLLIALLVSAEQAGRAAGISAAQARRRMMPIVRQTLANYEALGGAGAFSGPLVRGDVEVVRRHLAALKTLSPAREVYVALSKAAVKVLPVTGNTKLSRVLKP